MICIEIYVLVANDSVAAQPSRMLS